MRYNKRLLLSCFFALLLPALSLNGHASPAPNVSRKDLRHWPLPKDEHWIQHATQTATSAVWSVSPAYSRGADSAAFQMTGIPREWVAAKTSNHRLIRHLLTSLRFSGRLSIDNTGRWARFSSKHLRQNPALNMSIGFKPGSQFWGLGMHLFLYKTQRCYWLQCDYQHLAGDNDYAQNNMVIQQGGAAVTPQSFHRFLQLLRASIVQGKQGKSGTKLVDDGMYGS